MNVAQPSARIHTHLNLERDYYTTNETTNETRTKKKKIKVLPRFELGPLEGILFDNQLVGG